METTIRPSSAAVVPVRVSLNCGWCSEQVTDVPGQMDTAAGRLHLVNSTAPFRVSSGRPVCPRCGGPLFVDDWKVIRRMVLPEIAEPDDGPDSGEARTAA